MKRFKSVAALFVTASLLVACSNEEKVEQSVKESEEQELLPIDAKMEAGKFVSYAIEQNKQFILDTQLLASLASENKLEEAQKLYPIVAAYAQRMKPLMLQLNTKDEAMTSALLEIEKELFEQTSVKNVVPSATALTDTLTSVQEELVKLSPDARMLLSNTNLMLSQTIESLSSTSLANAEVYFVKAQTEAIEQLVAAFMTKGDATAAAKVVEQAAALNEVVAYYEVGKEDYVNYSFFTTTQKEELIKAVEALQNAWTAFENTVK